MKISNNNLETVSDETKEACAIETMHYMLRFYAQEKQMSFENALVLFCGTTAYETLFDLSTGVWREGPDYLRCLFEDALN